MRASIICLVGLVCLGSSADAFADDEALDWNEAEEACGDFTIESVVRRDLGQSLAEYSAVVRVGPGTYDKIGVHRVVKERRPGRPIHAAKAIVLAHGDLSTFDSAFLLSASAGVGLAPLSQSLGAYLALQNIDVWGWDRRATFVPNAETDLSAMADWGTQSSVDDMEIVTGLARWVRDETGSPGSRVFVGGWSRGAQIAVAFANHEAQLPWFRRNAKGLVLIDYTMKYPTTMADSTAAACQRAIADQAHYDAGLYANNTGMVGQFLGQLDMFSPETPSPIIPGVTNHQALLLALTNTYLLANVTPWYHFGAGSYSPLGFPEDLQYTPLEYMRAWVTNAPGYQPTLEILEGDQLQCGTPSPLVNHLDDVSMPVFYLGARGGFGDTGLPMLDLFGSNDKSSYIVQLAGSANPLFDYGHADLMFGDDASSVAWFAVKNWISSH